MPLKCCVNECTDNVDYFCIDSHCSKRFLCNKHEQDQQENRGHRNILPLDQARRFLKDDVLVLQRKFDIEIKQLDQIQRTFLNYFQGLQQEIVMENESLSRYIKKIISFKQIKADLSYELFQLLQNYKVQLKEILEKFRFNQSQQIDLQVLLQNRPTIFNHSQQNQLSTTYTENYSIGEELRQSNQLQKALKSYKQALQQISNTTDQNKKEWESQVRYGMALTLFKQKNYKKSLEEYSKILELGLEVGQNIYVSLCKTLIKAGFLEEAEVILNRITDQNIRRLLKFKIVIKKENIDETDRQLIDSFKTLCEEQVNQNPRNFKYIYYIGISLMKLQEYEKASFQFTQVLNIAPDFKKADYLLSFIKQKQSPQLFQIHMNNQNKFIQFFGMIKRLIEKTKQKFSRFNSRNDQNPFQDLD